MKPLGGKAYGSTPHLPGSRLGTGDHHCHEGQARIATEKVRDRHDRVIVTEKLDGSCVAVANVDGQIVAVNRAGYLCQSSPHRQHQVFAAWVRENEHAFRYLAPGERIVGEWLYMAHGTIYRPRPHDLPFVPFEVFMGNDRMSHDASRALFEDMGIRGAHIIHDGGPLSIERAMELLGERGHHGAQEQVEGAVWRVERQGKFDFLTKFVRHDKVDGKYFKDESGNPIEVLNFPELLK